GPKTASDLLKQFETLDGVLQAAKKGKIPGKKGETLQAHEKDARLSADLATLRDELPLECRPEDFEYRFEVSPACADFLRRMDFGSLLSRWAAQAQGGSKTQAPDVGEPPQQASRRSDATTVTAAPGSPEFRTVATERDFQNLLQNL